MCKFNTAQRHTIYKEALINLSIKDPNYYMCAVIEKASKQASTPDYICAAEFEEFGLFKSERDRFDWGDDMQEFNTRQSKLRVKELILMFCIEMTIYKPMKITQVKLTNGTTLSLGDSIIVECKPVIDDEESKTSVTKEINITEFKPYDDSSGDIWIVDAQGEVYAEKNFKSKCNYSNAGA